MIILHREEHPEDVPYSVVLQVPTTKAARIRCQLAYALPKALSDCMTYSAIKNAFEESGLYSPSSTTRKLNSLPMAPDSIRQKCHLPEPNPTEGRPILSGMWLTEPAKIERILRWKEKVQKPQSQREKKHNYNNTPPTSEPLLPKGLYLYNVSSQSYIIDTLSH